MKKNSLAAFLLPGCFALIQSCCKGYCSNEEIFAIDFQGFTPAEIDKIKIVSYDRNNVSVPVDSYYVSSNNIIKRDTARAYPDKPLKSDFNFRIIIEIPGLDYSLTDIETKHEDCNCRSGTYKTITGYKLNGVQYPASDSKPLVIKK
jgi:hypothetical protein